jgi:hypothetical protein
MMKRLAVLVGIVFTLSAFAQINVGFGVRDITPDPLLPVSGGVGPSRATTEAKGNLTVRAMVLEKGAMRVAIVDVDSLGVPSVLGNQARAKIAAIPPENILIGATHTHSAPDMYGFPDTRGGTGADMDYLEQVVNRIAEAVNDAAANTQPAHLRIATGEAKGQIAYNYYAPQLYDPRCTVIQAVTPQGTPMVTLVNYAIHPEVIGAGRGILSPDLCGPLYDRIEEKTGAPAIFMNGALGGMITADVRKLDTLQPSGTSREERNTWEECIRIGTLLADEALRIINGAPVQEDPQLAAMAKEVVFPIDSEMMRLLIQHSPVLSQGIQDGDTTKVPTQLNLLNIGNAQVLTIPGEALPNIGYYLKRNMKGEHQLLFGLTNDAFGYILVEEDFDSFTRYDYISRTSLGEQTWPTLRDAALQMIADSPEPDRVKR